MPASDRLRSAGTVHEGFQGSNPARKVYAGDDTRDGVTTRSVGFVRDVMVVGARILKMSPNPFTSVAQSDHAFVDAPFTDT
jgi:hypothetical protein